MRPCFQSLSQRDQLCLWQEVAVTQVHRLGVYELDGAMVSRDQASAEAAANHAVPDEALGHSGQHVTLSSCQTADDILQVA